jgi:hypothetical protein
MKQSASQKKKMFVLNSDLSKIVQKYSNMASTAKLKQQR